ncbi:MAG: hypothetical protein M1826_007288 [Phylliscum demangeonii]|nr:MAG: hypothetical protein M1826_007288 [Phylliscum demangeonii]
MDQGPERCAGASPAACPGPHHASFPAVSVYFARVGVCWHPDRVLRAENCPLKRDMGVWECRVDGLNQTVECLRSAPRAFPQLPSSPTPAPAASISMSVFPAPDSPTVAGRPAFMHRRDSLKTAQGMMWSGIAVLEPVEQDLDDLWTAAMTSTTELAAQRQDFRVQAPDHQRLRTQLRDAESEIRRRVGDWPPRIGSPSDRERSGP